MVTIVVQRMFSPSKTGFKVNVIGPELFALAHNAKGPASSEALPNSGMTVKLGDQLRRASENCAPLSCVQFSWLWVTNEQLTRDCVLRTSEVMLISTSVGESLL